MAKYTRLTLSERRKIGSFLEMKLSVRQIAGNLCRAPSSISREIRCNQKNGVYRFGEAHRLAQSKLSRRTNKLDTDLALRRSVLKGLKQKRSPQQIAGDLKRRQVPFYICAESIYRYIYTHIELEWYKLLPKQHKKRWSSRLQKNKAKKRVFPKINSIENRSPVIDKRRMIGHWEGDTIRFAHSKINVTTLVERTSRLVRLQLNRDLKSEGVIGKIKSLIQSSNKKTWKSITFDNGSEFKLCRPIEELSCKVYFTHPYSPWERGTNENTNGRLRRYLARSMDAREITPELLKEIEDQLNNTPRKCLNYRTPIAVFRSRGCCTRM